MPLMFGYRSSLGRRRGASGKKPVNRGSWSQFTKQQSGQFTILPFSTRNDSECENRLLKHLLSEEVPLKAGGDTRQHARVKLN